jgi:hypothetical protein
MAQKRLYHEVGQNLICVGGLTLIHRRLPQTGAIAARAILWRQDPKPAVFKA